MIKEELRNLRIIKNDRKEKVREMWYIHGYRAIDIASELNITRGRVYQIIEELEYEKNTTK